MSGQFNVLEESIKSKKTLFNKLFGNSPLIKVIDFFLDNRIFDYSKTDVAKHIGLSRMTVHKVFDSLSELNIILHNRTCGKAKLFILNKKNPVVVKLIELDRIISRGYGEQLIKNKEKILIIKPN
ncbi:MAG: hypothetical protein GOU97_04155 [Nanoarchaeota archaeon]|nr:hypothetical protein [Nanoarchaeota archaeon]